jgi:Helix-turn-helix domain
MLIYLTCLGLKAKVPCTNSNKMTVKSFLTSQFDEIIKRLDLLGVRLEYAQLTSNMPATYDSNTTAKLLGVSTRTLSKYRKQRLIGFVQNGRKIIYTRQHIEAFLACYNVNSLTSKTKSHGKR